MKNLIFLLLLIAISCTETKSTEAIETSQEQSNRIIKKEFKAILDSAGVEGSILIFSDKDQKYFSNNFEWSKTGQLPASTFKIPNSIIALELGIMENDSSIIYWDGKPKYLPQWEQDLSFKDAFHTSCVPCYQEIAREIGVERMKKFTSEFDFGKMSIDSSNIDLFWLEGTSQINQFEQVDFLRRFNEQRLPISQRTYILMQRMMIIEENDDFTLRGKTGWSNDNDIDNCWFVGFIETTSNFSYFATNIRPEKQADINSALKIRKNITVQALKSLDLMD